jgi:hypothetical protein
VVPLFKFGGLLTGRQRTPIHEDQPASSMKGMERVIQNGSGMHKFVVGVGYEDGVNLAFRQMRVVLVALQRARTGGTSPEAGH